MVDKIEYDKELIDMANDIIKSMVPAVLNQLFLENAIDREKTQDPGYLWSLVGKELLGRDYYCYTSIHDQFLETAKNAIDSNKPMVAVVLIVTAIEQLMNVYYRNVLELRGLPQEDITKIIRRCNVDVKIDWLITLVLGHELPNDLKKSITDLVELRNSIVHYKAIPGPLEGDEDSATRIRARIENLGFDPLEIPLILEQTLENILEETNPNYKMSKDLTEIMFKSPNKSA